MILLDFLAICGRLIWGWINGHSHHYTLLRWDDEEACLYVECWGCGQRSYGDSKIKENPDAR